MDLREIRRESVDWIELIECGVIWGRTYITSHERLIFSPAELS